MALDRRGALRLGGAVLAVLASALLAFTLLPRAVPLAIGLVGAILLHRQDASRMTLIAVGALLILSGVFRGLNVIFPSDLPPKRSLEAGQYTASSTDLLGMVTVRLVVRDGGALIFAEAHAPPLLGLDQHTLYLEPYRVLVHQGIPAAPDPSSDPQTAAAVYSAVSAILNGQYAPETPDIPAGARAVPGGQDTYFGMFPNEFDHHCDVAQVADGQYTGRSSNPAFPATVQITVRAGRLVKIDLLDAKMSEHGAPAREAIPKAMILANSPHVDVISGATRTSFILRSAVFHACRAGLAAPHRPHPGSPHTGLPNAARPAEAPAPPPAQRDSAPAP